LIPVGSVWSSTVVSALVPPRLAQPAKLARAGERGVAALAEA
jgi:hypothetical protein